MEASYMSHVPSISDQDFALVSPRVGFEEEEQEGALLGIQLVQLQCLARAVTAAGRVLLERQHGEGGPCSNHHVTSSSSSSSSVCAGGGWELREVAAAAGLAAAAFVVVIVVHLQEL